MDVCHKLQKIIVTQVHVYAAKTKYVFLVQLLTTFPTRLKYCKKISAKEIAHYMHPALVQFCIIEL